MSARVRSFTGRRISSLFAMARLTITGQENLITPGFYMPNRLCLKTGRALHHLLHKRVCYLVDSTFPPAPDVMAYLRGKTVPAARLGDEETPAEQGADKPVIEYFDFRHTTPLAVREQVRAHLEAGRSVVFLPGLLARARGCIADVPSPFLSALGSLHIAPLPVFVGYYGDRLGTLFTLDPGEGRAVLSVLPRLAPGPRTGERLLAAWMERGAELFAQQPFLDGSLPAALVSSMRAHAGSKITDGASGQCFSYARVLALSMLLAKILGARREEVGERVGVVLPPGLSAVIAVVGCLLAGVTPVMINYASSRQAFESSVRQAGLRRFLTDRGFREKLAAFPWPPDDRLFFVSDIEKIAGRRAVIANTVLARTVPASILSARFHAQQRHGSDEGVLLFTSGSSGEPKGVMLTHRMLLANAAQVACRLDLRGSRFLCSLPVFHSFGLTATLILPLLLGRPMCTYPRPTDARRICELLREHRSTLVCATPTFARAMLRRADADTFKHMRHFIVGAEKLPRDLDAAYRERCGVKLLEAYGLTEASPICTLNAPDAEPVRGSAFYVPGRVEGSIGAMLPGMAVRITDAEDETRELDLTEQGMLWYKGANVFSGYLGKPQLNDEIFRNGWFRCGDIGRLDLNGFAFLGGRLSRFSKIGGEMVPHEGVERVLAECLELPADRQCIAVTSIPDEQKGEALVLLSTLPEHQRTSRERESLAVIRKALSERELPNLWAPRYIVPVEEIPVLGTGKMDLRRCKMLAEEALRTSTHSLAAEEEEDDDA